MKPTCADLRQCFLDDYQPTYCQNVIVALKRVTELYEGGITRQVEALDTVPVLAAV
jgi:hypothetical protein